MFVNVWINDCVIMWCNQFSPCSLTSHSSMFSFNCIMCLMIAIPFGYGVSSYVACSNSYGTLYMYDDLLSPVTHIYMTISTQRVRQVRTMPTILHAAYVPWFGVFLLSSCGFCIWCTPKKSNSNWAVQAAVVNIIGFPPQELREYAVYHILCFGVCYNWGIYFSWMER